MASEIESNVQLTWFFDLTERLTLHGLIDVDGTAGLLTVSLNSLLVVIVVNALSPTMDA